MGDDALSFEFLRDVVRRGAGIVLTAEQEYLVHLRLGPLLRQEKLGSVGELVTRLRQETTPELRKRVVEAFTTNETSFFRDVDCFNTLRDAILPGLIERRRTEKRLTIWSAASSSGQEIYSIGMTLRESFPEITSWSIRLIASDLHADMLERTRAGSYSQIEVNRGLPAPMLTKYFRRDRTEWQIADELRKMVETVAANLTQQWPSLPTMDLIFLRNVLIYFDNETKKTILKKARALLRSDGFLLLGTAETPMLLGNWFVPVQFGKSVAYRPNPAAGVP